jgi:hypothetical protein
MAKVNPIDTQKFLGGIDYPTSRDELIAHARDHGADDDVVDALSGLDDREYDGPDDVSEALGDANAF